MRGYFCSSSGHVTDEVMAAYIENEGDGQSGDFRVDFRGEELQPASGRSLEGDLGSGACKPTSGREP